MISSLQFTVHSSQFTVASAAAINNCKLKTENSLKTENGKLTNEEGSVL